MTIPSHFQLAVLKTVFRIAKNSSVRSEVFKTGLAGARPTSKSLCKDRVAIHSQEAIVDCGMEGEGAANEHRLTRAHGIFPGACSPV